MRLIFVRHGEPDYENDCLTPNGKEQAKCTADRLRNEKITAIYSSPMGRAMETASYTARYHGLEIQPLGFMHEIDWGDIGDTAYKLPYDGHPWTLAYEYLSETPDTAEKGDWRGHRFFKDNRCMEYYDMISAAFDKFLAGYGLERKNGIYFCRKKRDDTIALFAHGGSGAVMFSHVLSLPFPFVLTAIPYGVCSVSIIEFGEQSDKPVIPRLELFNDMGHIESFKEEKLHFEK